MPFQYKRVLLIGATSGIGAAMADKLVQEGAKVIAVGRRQERLDAFVKKHGAGKASFIRFDTTDKDGADAFVNKTLKDYPDLDCVFFNSGTQSQVRLSRPAEVDLTAFHNEINVNFTSVVDLIIKFLPHLQAKEYPTGLIVTGTHLAILPAATLPAYSASKAALHSFVMSLREQNRQNKTKIIEILPPVVQTELHDYMGEERGRSLGMPVDVFVDQAYTQLAAGDEEILIGTVGTPDTLPLYREVYSKRKQIFDNLTKVLLSHFTL